MTKYVLLSILLININIYSQNKINEYILFDKHQSSDINYQKIDSLNSSEFPSGINLLNDIFDVKSGNFIVYRFLNIDKGVLYDGGLISEVLNLVILKVNNENIIEDGYYYSLTNPEMPRTCHLFKLIDKLEFEERMNLNTMNFKRIDKVETDKYTFIDCIGDYYLTQEGILICK